MNDSMATSRVIVTKKDGVNIPKWDCNVKLEVIGVCCVCGGEATHKVYALPDRATKELKGICCQGCLQRMLETGTKFADLTEERLNKENQHGK